MVISVGPVQDTDAGTERRDRGEDAVYSGVGGGAGVTGTPAADSVGTCGQRGAGAVHRWGNSCWPGEGEDHEGAGAQGSAVQAQTGHRR